MPKGIQVRTESQRDLYLGTKVDSMRDLVDLIALALKIDFLLTIMIFLGTSH